MTTPVHVAVIGGGISGLAAAWSLRQRLGPSARITVLEKNAVLGGHVRVSEVAGLPVDEGAESLLARRREAVDLAAAVGLASDVTAPAAVGAGVWSRGQVHRMPPGTVMGIPADPRDLRGLLSSAELAMAPDPVVPVELPVTGDVAIGELVAAHFGRAVVDRLVEPLLGGVYAGHASRLSLDATVPALAVAARRTSSLAEAVRDVQAAGASQGTSAARPFAGIAGGIGRLPGAVAAASDAQIRTGTTVRRIERTPTGWRVVTGPTVDEAALEVDAIVLAVPPPAAARLLHDVAAVAATELGSIEMASMAIVTLVVPRDAFPGGAPPESSGFLVPPVEGCAVKAVTYSSVKWPWLSRLAGDLVAIRASVGRAGEVRELQRDDADLIAAVRADLAAMTGLAGSTVDTRVTRWGGALPQYAVGHLDRVERIRADVAAVPGLAVCGAAYDGVGVPACIAAAARAADEVVADLTPGEASGPATRSGRIET